MTKAVQNGRHLFGTYVKFFREKKIHTCAFQWVTNISFSENFTYMLNG